MPTSKPEKIPYVLRTAMLIAPKKVLDIGAGFGKYGLLLREYLELWGMTVEESIDTVSPKFDKENWKVTIHALEIHECYIKDYHRYFYDKIIIGDVRDLIDQLDSDYDLVLICDVIEHIDKEAGKTVLINLQRKSNSIILTSPIGYTKQKAYFGNQNERHVCGWTQEELEELGFNVTIVRGGLCATWRVNVP
jgi:2-polyprenyl-3-methyl-5-hydroxy-6-metoxy-1,4-benzoquinol methylase